jgi:mannosyltransferase OCH1-like enzyme
MTETIITEKNLEEIQAKVKLIALSLSSLGIDSELIPLPNNQEDLNITVSNITSLCQQNKELIRRACTLAEQMKQENQPLTSYGLVKDYFDNFSQQYQENLAAIFNIPREDLECFALKRLVELLFYTGTKGDLRVLTYLNLWETKHYPNA